MHRRQFLAIAPAAIGAGIVAPASRAAASSDMAGGVYHTGEAPGRWSSKVLSHLPSVSAERVGAGVTLHVRTRHTMEGYDHYIVKHVVLDRDFRFVAEKMFDPRADMEPVSRFNLDDYSGVVYVLSVCNRHDTWMTHAEV